MRPRRYFIHKYKRVTWTLVYDAGRGRWHVEKKGPERESALLSIEAFERSDSGKQLGDALSTALKAAQYDA